MSVPLRPAGEIGGLAAQLRAVLGEAHVLTGADDRLPYLVEERRQYQGAAPIVVRPGSPREVSAIVQICHAACVPMVPQGGNTGLVGGSVSTAGEVLISLGRLNRIRDIDPENFTITVDAGCILQNVQAAAAAAGRLFPLSLGAQGSCQIGGNLASNAGGINVLRYGNARDLTLGLEVVLPDGQIWDGMRALYKDNTGYALKHLFIGSEGTLGIITGAVLKLFPPLRERQVALCALPSIAQVPKLLALAREHCGETITAFEIMSETAIAFAVRHGAANPVADPAPWFVLIELADTGTGQLRTKLEALLEEALAGSLIADAAMAMSEAQIEAIWHLREAIPEAQKREGGSIKHDISVPVSKIPAFIAQAGGAVHALLPEARIIAFGHAADGNIHYNISQPSGAEKQAFLARWEEMNKIVHDIVVSLGGSISAEHGIGLLKAGELAHYKDPLSLALMRQIRGALDPDGLMNPGKILGPVRR